MFKFKVAIDFGDNDFINTFVPLLEHVGTNLPFKPTKDQFVEIVNNLSFGFYLAFQNKFEYGQDEYEHIKKYLKITKEKVYFDDEVETLINKTFPNGECFILECGEYIKNYVWIL